jgi:hypothetical protein
MFLQWTSVALTVTGLFVWFSGANQSLGYAIFMSGGIMWFILKLAEKKRLKKAEHKPLATLSHEVTTANKPKPRRQSDVGI